MSNKSWHTEETVPGFHYVVDEKGGLVCICLAPDEEANARLIAAAPTGYALLKRLGAAVMHMSVNHCSCRPDYECLNCHDAKELALYFEDVEGK